MQPIKKLDVTITDKVVVGYDDLTKWQTIINYKEDEDLQSLVEKSQKPTAKGKDLWESVPKEKADLVKQLYIEQKGLCCYCGQRLNPDNNKIIIEHLNPKESFPNMVFDYQNLYASCEGGNPLVKVIKPQNNFTIREISIQNQVDIANITVPNLPKISSEISIPAQTEVKIRFGHQKDLHCDAHKDKDKIFIQPIFYDKLVSNLHKPENDYNVFSCIGKIRYFEDGRIFIENQEQHQTIEILNLNYHKLKKERAKVYEYVEEFIESLEEEEITNIQKVETINTKIQEIETMALQEAFAFVRIYFLKEIVDRLS
jgi:uncharacterized protein (TIGR02646 family)